jgi:hypothetical protein
VCARARACDIALNTSPQTRDFDRMRKDGVLSISVKQEELAFPTDDQNRLDVFLYGDLYEWFVFALLACPQLLEVDALAALIKDTLTRGGYFLSLYRTSGERCVD